MVSTDAAQLLAITAPADLLAKEWVRVATRLRLLAEQTNLVALALLVKKEVLP